MKFKDLNPGDYFTTLTDNVMVVSYMGYVLIGSTLKEGTRVSVEPDEEVTLMDVTIETKPKVLTFQELKCGEKFRFKSSHGNTYMKLNRDKNTLARFASIEGECAGMVCSAEHYEDDVVERVVE